MVDILVTKLYNDRIIDGSIINAFEYFYTCWERDKTSKLYIIYNNLSCDYREFFRLKYNINLKCLDNIVLITLEKISFQKFRNILIIDGEGINILPDKIFFYNKILALSGMKHKINHKIKKYFCEYNHLCPEGYNINYKSKIRYDLFKIPKYLEDKVFINSPHNPKISLGLKNEITREQLNTPNMFGKYNKMIYIQNPKIIDRKPRCFLECKFLNIPYEFIFKGIRDGGYYRYNESLKETLEERLLTQNDEIIKELFNDY